LAYPALIAVDLDGTLLTSRSVLPRRGAKIIRKAVRSGARVVLATTRISEFVRGICRSLRIDEPMICSNGAEIWAGPKGPLWCYRTIPMDIAREIAEMAASNGWNLWMAARPAGHNPAVTTSVDGRVTTLQRALPEVLVGEPVAMFSGHPQAIQRIVDLCERRQNRCHTEVYFDASEKPYSIGIFAWGADKGTSLKLVMEKLGVGKERVMAIGDNNNDLLMFQQAALSVAMGNAPASVKNAASVVAPTNDEEGVAWAIGEFVLSKGR
jgi:Cof subfamily protein (haloacid dehalogenase superfamily)